MLVKCSYIALRQSGQRSSVKHVKSYTKTSVNIADSKGFPLPDLLQLMSYWVMTETRPIREEVLPRLDILGFHICIREVAISVWILSF